MNDRDLLVWAAKAAGIEGKYGYAPDADDYYYNGNVEGICTELPDGRSYVWNPLEDDGDALRLAVACCLPLDIEDEQTYGSRALGIVEQHGSDPCAATRRAIVRAAAEIGRQMQEGGAA